MDNLTSNRLNYKCQLFNRLYHSKPCDMKGCLNVNVSQEYMCPNIGTPLRPPSDSVSNQCFKPAPQIGKHQVCNRENETEKRSGVEVDQTLSFLPDRLGSLTKDNVIETFNSLKQNPDFVYSTNLIKQGGMGIKEYFSRFKSGEMFGSGEIADNLIDKIKEGAENLTDAVNQIAGAANNMTLNNLIEDFVSYYATGVLPDIYASEINSQLQSLKNNGKGCVSVVSNTLGELTVGDILDMGQRFANQKEFNKLSTKIVQTGGAVYQLMTTTTNNSQIYDQYLVELFENLKSTVNYVSHIFKKRMTVNGAPPDVLNNVNRIQKGLNLCLQMLEYELVVERKKKQQPESKQALPPNFLTNMKGGSTDNVKPGVVDTPRVYYPNITGLCRQSGLDNNCPPCTTTVTLGDNEQISPTWYFNQTKRAIAKHPEVSRRIKDGQLPEILSGNREQLTNNCFSCTQPNWKPNCM